MRNLLRDPKIRTIGDLFVRNAERFGEELGVVSGEHRFTWGQVNQRANRLANGLLGMGMDKGDRVALLNPNNHLWVEVHGGVAKAGGILVPLNYRLAPQELAKILNDSGARWLIADKSFLEKCQEASSLCPGVQGVLCHGGKEEEGTLDYEELLAKSSDREPESVRNVKEDDVHLIMYTGGTTGSPKGAMWLHQRTLDMVYFYPFPLDVSFRARFLMHFACFAGGVTQMLLSGIYGSACLVMMDFDPKAVLDTIEREKIEIIAMVPTICQMIVDTPYDREYDMSSLKRIYYGSMPISASLLKKAIPFFGCEFVQAYGMTENTGGTMTELLPHDHVVEGNPKRLERLSSAGRPARGIDLRIIDEEDNELPRGQVGEIVFRSMGLMAGYWNMPEETARVMRGGWFHSGDIGYLDEEGYLFIVSRKHDMIITGGYNVYSVEIENVISQHEGVSENIVIGVTDSTWGEKVVAVVRLKEGADVSAEDIQDFCRKQIASYKIPKEVEFVQHPLPRNHFGKIVRNEARELYLGKVH